MGLVVQLLGRAGVKTDVINVSIFCVVQNTPSSLKR